MTPETIERKLLEIASNAHEIKREMLIKHSEFLTLKEDVKNHTLSGCGIVISDNRKGLNEFGTVYQADGEIKLTASLVEGRVIVNIEGV